MLIQKKNLIFVFGSILLCAASFIYFVWGLHDSNVGYLSIAVICLWGGTLMSQLGEKQHNLPLIFLTVTIFLFLLSKVVARWISEREVYMPFDFSTMKHIYMLIYFSILGLLLGELGSYVIVVRNQFNMNYIKKTNTDLNLLRSIIFPIAIIVGFANLATVVERIFFFSAGMGGALRISFTSSLPTVLTMLAGFYTLSISIYLATFPKKKECTIVFLQYTIINALKMTYGSRSDFVLGLMFIITYYAIRDRLKTDGQEKWIGKKEIVVTIVSIPLLIILLVFVGSYRVGETYYFTSFLDTLLEFFESQGSSIDILGYAYENADRLPKLHFLYLIDNTYTFITTNPIARMLFGTSSYATNTVERALYGTSLDQTLYYIINRTSYLNGFGCGSSYMAETYLAFGYFGSFVFNFVFARVLKRINLYNYNTPWKNAIIFVFLQSLFFIPRAGFDEFVGDFTRTSQIFCVVVIWIIYKFLLNRKNSNQIRSKEMC